MKAHQGDRIILAARHTDEPTRQGEVLEVRGANGEPPYLVRWADGHTGLMYPGPGSVLRVEGEHLSIVPAESTLAGTDEMHNASVDEDLARAGECAQVHLPTGKMCTLPHGHKGSCEFISADAAYASLARFRTDERR